MKKILLSLIIILNFANINAQNSFPKSWLGNYQGNLEIYAVDSVQMNVKMNLEIKKTVKDSVYQWVTTYHIKDKKDIRSYELKVIDTQKGLFQIDEKNTIVIDAYYRMGIFTSFFEVQKTFIIATYTKEKDSIIFEIISGKKEPVSVTGGGISDKKKIPEVTTYPVTGRQRAVLNKID